MGRKRVAVEIATIRLKLAGPTRPRLRFDRVVLRLIADLQAALQEVVPEGEAVIVTCTAPIRQAGRTAIEIQNRVRDGLPRRDLDCTIHGNRIRLRRVTGMAGMTRKIIGFVHNPDTDAGMLLDLAQTLMEQAGRKQTTAAPSRRRWLVLVDASGLPRIDIRRQVWDQIGMPGRFGRVLLVRADGQVETLQA